MNKPFNPLAFPRPMASVGMLDSNDAQEGMTLRDYFAGKVINGICCNQFYLSALLEDFKSVTDDEMTSKIAQISYEMADAMLKAREVSND